MENKRTLELKIIENDVSNSEVMCNPSLIARDVNRADFDYILKNVDDTGIFKNFAGRYAGTVEELVFESLDEDDLDDLSEAVLSYNEWNKMGRPLKIIERRTYEPIK